MYQMLDGHGDNKTDWFDEGEKQQGGGKLTLRNLTKREKEGGGRRQAAEQRLPFDYDRVKLSRISLQQPGEKEI